MEDGGVGVTGEWDWKDTVVINEQTEAGSFVPWQPAQITIY